MFNKNSEHDQRTLFKGGAFGLNKLFKDARDSEEYFFYETIFSNIDEEIFKPLFCHFGRLYRYIRRYYGDSDKSGLKQFIYSKFASDFGKNQFNFNKIVNIWKLSFLMKKITKLINLIIYETKLNPMLKLKFLKWTQIIEQKNLLFDIHIIFMFY